MGIFPSSFVPKHMKYVTGMRLEADDYVPKGYLPNCVLSTDNYYNDPPRLHLIDEWVGTNALGTVAFNERWPRHNPIWTCYFYFTEECDYLAFKLMWEHA